MSFAYYIPGMSPIVYNQELEKLREDEIMNENVTRAVRFPYPKTLVLTSFIVTILEKWGGSTRNIHKRERICLLIHDAWIMKIITKIKLI